MNLKPEYQKQYDDLMLPFDWGKPLLIEAQARFCLKAANEHFVLKQTVETLRELLQVGGETIAELRDGEDCDHSVGVCWCGVTKLQEEIEEALKQTENII